MIAWPAWLRSQHDRTSEAQAVQKRLSDQYLIPEVLRRSSELATRLQVEHSDLSQHTAQLRSRVGEGETPQDVDLLSHAAGIVIEAIRRRTGMRLFDVQVRAGIVVSVGAVAQMQTGEGKTLSGVLPAYAHALGGRGVHVATTNGYLAKRDHDDLSPVFSELGMSTGLLGDDMPLPETRNAYLADVTYGPGNAFGFDFLRDQLTLTIRERRGLGQNLLALASGGGQHNGLRQRPLATAIVDEIDHVLLDDAGSPLILSTSGEGVAADAEVHESALKFASNLVPDVHFQMQSGKRQLSFTDPGFRFVYDNIPDCFGRCVLRPWHEYVALALQAQHFQTCGVDYVIQDEKIQIVDQSTGRIFQDRHWSAGLHQAVLAKERLPISPETGSLAKITRQRFYRHYDVLGGMTGTAHNCQREFAAVYGLAVCEIPLRSPSKRTLLPRSIFRSQIDKYNAIADETRQMIETSRAVLIGTNNIDQSQAVSECLNQHGIPHQLLNGIQTAEEAEIIAKAGQLGAVTVATNMAGRGTDIKLCDRVRGAGGLHVIVTEHHALARVDRQLIGRSARCGDPGTARFFLSADDDILVQRAPWISRAIRRQQSSHGIHSRLESQIRRFQMAEQRTAASHRWEILEQDQRMEQILDKKESLDGCWKL